MVSLYVSDTGSSAGKGLPNAAQFGWTTAEYEEYRQLVDYVNEVKEYRDEIFRLTENIPDLITELERLYDHISDMYADLMEATDEVRGYLVDFNVKYQDILDKYPVIVKMYDETVVNSKAAQDAALAASLSEVNAHNSAVAAKDSETKADEAYRKSQELYEALSKGQVYRGTWNPNSGAYPAVHPTNSIWDVVLNENQEEVSFDGKRWFWGDRLIYVLDTGDWFQVEAGTTVKSINGKTGAVVLTASDLGALPSNGIAKLSGALEISGSGSALSLKSINDNASLYLLGKNQDDSPLWYLGKGDAGDSVAWYHYKHDNSITIDSTGVNVGKKLLVNDYHVYTRGDRPTAQEVGAIPDVGYIRLEGTQPYIALADTDDIVTYTLGTPGGKFTIDQSNVGGIFNIDKDSANFNVPKINASDVSVRSLVATNHASVSNYGTILSMEIGQDHTPYISVDYTYRALSFNKVDQSAAMPGNLHVGKTVYSNSVICGTEYNLPSTGYVNWNASDLWSAGLGWRLGMDPHTGYMHFHTYNSGTFASTPYTFRQDGVLVTANEIRSTSQNSFRIAGSNYGNFWRNDGSHLYLMFTDAGQALDGNYNNLRPVYFNLTTGAASFGHDVTCGSLTTSYGGVSSKAGFTSITAETQAMSLQNSVNGNIVQMALHSNGVRELTTRDGAGNWKTHFTFNQDGSTSTSELRSSGSFSVLGSYGYFWNASRPDAAGYGWGLIENSANGNLEWHNYQSNTWQGLNFYFASFSGQGYATGGWHTGSDERFKDDIKPLNTQRNPNSWLEKVCSLTPSTFKYKTSDDTRLGFIAQDVQEHIPEAVSVGSTGKDPSNPDATEEERLFLDSMAIIAAQNQAIKELKAQHDELFNIVNQLTEEVKRLKSEA